MPKANPFSVTTSLCSSGVVTTPLFSSCFLGLGLLTKLSRTAAFLACEAGRVIFTLSVAHLFENFFYVVLLSLSLMIFSNSLNFLWLCSQCPLVVAILLLFSVIISVFSLLWFLCFNVSPLSSFSVVPFAESVLVASCGPHDCLLYLFVLCIHCLPEIWFLLLWHTMRDHVQLFWHLHWQTEKGF